MSQEYRLLFVHGWGFCQDFWKPVSHLLQDFSIHYIDLGFVKNDPTSKDVIQRISQQQHTYIAIGHSLGLLYLLKQFPYAFHHYIAINSFLRFSKNRDYISGVPARILQRMSKGIDKNTTSVLLQFYQQCASLDIPPNKTNHSALKTGLEWLEKDDLRDALPSITNKLTILASNHDPVVSCAMTTDSFKGNPINWVQDNTHLLPITQPNLCATTIRNIALIP